MVLPESNVANLMLKEEVVDAIREGKFHIWPVRTIDEGIEVLTGVNAGERLPDGSFETDTVNFLVDQRLSHMAEEMQKFMRADGHAGQHKQEDNDAA